MAGPADWDREFGEGAVWDLEFRGVVLWDWFCLGRGDVGNMYVHGVRGLGVRCASHFRRNVKMSFCFVV